jgi:hypothetical protein
MKHRLTATIGALISAAVLACSLPAALASDQNDMIVKLQLSGQLRLDCKAGKAWLDPELWNAVDAEAKENFARTVFGGCHHVRGVKSITIYDAQSAKKLATYSEEDGLKVD